MCKKILSLMVFVLFAFGESFSKWQLRKNMFLCTNHFKLYYYAFYLLNHRLTRIKSCSITRNTLNKVYYMNIPIRNARRSLLQLRVKLEEKIYKYSFIHFKVLAHLKGTTASKVDFLE